MKKFFYPFIALVVMLLSCSKEDDANTNTNIGSSDQLIPASTGWERVSSVPYQNAVSGLAGANSMTPYDLSLVGDELALLYSDNYKFFAVNGHTVMKLMLNNGNVDVKTKAVKLNYDRGGNAIQIHRFIPGTFSTLSLAFQNNFGLLYDEAGGPNAGRNFGSINVLPTMRWYADGSILVGLNDGPHSSATWTYKYPATGDFKYIINEWNGDTTTNLMSSPMKLSDGNIYDMVFSKLNDVMYFSVLKNLKEPQAGSMPNYEMICRNTVASLDPNNSYQIITTDVQGDTKTILIGQNSFASNGSPWYSKLIALRWKKGTTTLEELYTFDNSDIDLGSKILGLSSNSQFPNEIRLTPDGSTYFLREYHASQVNNADYTALAIINKNGIKEIGKIKETEMEAIKRKQFGLHCCRYFNGSYYAVVHPMEEYDYSINAPEFRIEVVKITP
jgi:hypothetical protein